jgi:hypothetical protein
MVNNKSNFNLFLRVKIVYDHLAKMIFWNMILRMILEGYIEYSISSIMNVQDVSDEEPINDYRWRGKHIAIRYLHLLR